VEGERAGAGGAVGACKCWEGHFLGWWLVVVAVVILRFVGLAAEYDVCVWKKVGAASFSLMWYSVDSELGVDLEVLSECDILGWGVSRQEDKGILENWMREE